MVEQPVEGGLPEGMLVPSGVTVLPTEAHIKVTILIANETSHDIVVKQGQKIADLFEPELVVRPQCGTQAPTIDPERFDFRDSPLSEERKTWLRKKICKRSKVFSQYQWDVGCAKGVEHNIRLHDAQPFQERSRKIALSEIEDVQQHLKELAENGVIAESRSPYAPPILVVRKKNEKLWMCIDYRTLNSCTMVKQCTTSRIQDALDCLLRSQCFSVLDLRSGCYQIPLEEEDKEKTAFILPIRVLPVRTHASGDFWGTSHIPASYGENCGQHELTANKGSCSTWGAGHFSTFDNYLYDFSGKCNYIFATVCNDVTPDFNIQFRRGMNKNIERIIIEMGAVIIVVEKNTIVFKGVGIIKLPYANNGIQIAPFGRTVRLVTKLMEMELIVVWNNDDYLMVMVERKYMRKTCGMCGNFDGKELNEFVSEGKLLDAYQFAALQKIDDPAEICPSQEMALPHIPHKKYARICSQLLNLVSPSCNVSKKEFVIRCQLDMQDCSDPGQRNCTCATLSEYSRQCTMSHQAVSDWRSVDFCSIGKCSANQIYKECGSPCVKTCSNPDYSCSSYCTYGCFCPEGTVLDDISKNRTCVPIDHCPCTLNGERYDPGATMKAACRTCKCTMGQWDCSELPCPGRCSLEGGSFVTTFDSKSYRFHGVCTYILMKSPSFPHNGTLMALYDKSGYSHSETSLSAIIYLSAKDKIIISQNQLLMDDDELKWLPYRSGDITIFRQSSTHLQMYTTFGLDIVFQMWPVFQVFIRVGLLFKGRTLGLCGNYNGDTTDDFMTSMDITEGTAALFVDSWRSGNCHPAAERDTDPCSMSQLNKMSAETHCSILTKKGTVFEKCHSVVNPTAFYKRCIYQACNYEETFPYICSALASYARVCASMGLILVNWRDTIDNCTISCTGNQTFSYHTEACGRTCLSLSDKTLECYPTDIPIDGCNCPRGTYLNHRSECVRKSMCPCYLEDKKFILPDQSTIIGGITCYCINGNLSCTGRPLDPAENCKPPKKYVSCSQHSENKYGAACSPTCQMLATGIECVPTRCESGCVCTDGLYENLDGMCVPPDECPCEYGGISYKKGEEIHTECKTCTCTRGKWKCVQKSKCSSTCTLYGEGHVVTFDGQRFVFDGNCEYILATDGCGTNSSHSTFKIVTENVICGRSGVTCSRSIKIYLGNMTLILADENYYVYGENPLTKFHVKKNVLHLMFDIIIPGKYNMTLIWNKHMNIFIKIFREIQDHLCGLCGNYNGNMRDDFETRSKYVAANEMEFVNSWKENPLCGDVFFAVDPCNKNPYRKAWSVRKCSILHSPVFAPCHSKVYVNPHYEDCVRDSCGCDTGGDCECMCDAIAVYAKACLDVGVCIDWRTPEFCPVYCDYFNIHQKAGSEGTYKYNYWNEQNCTWHYRPCNCPNQNYKYVNIEGCYNCSYNEYFDYEEGQCKLCIMTTIQPSARRSSSTVETSTTAITPPTITITESTKHTLLSSTPTTRSTTKVTIKTKPITIKSTTHSIPASTITKKTTLSTIPVITLTEITIPITTIKTTETTIPLTTKTPVTPTVTVISTGTKTIESTPPRSTSKTKPTTPISATSTTTVSTGSSPTSSAKTRRTATVTRTTPSTTFMETSPTATLTILTTVPVTRTTFSTSSTETTTSKSTPTPSTTFIMPTTQITPTNITLTTSVSSTSSTETKTSKLIPTVSTTFTTPTTTTSPVTPTTFTLTTSTFPTTSTEVTISKSPVTVSTTFTTLTTRTTSPTPTSLTPTTSTFPTSPMETTTSKSTPTITTTFTTPISTTTPITPTTLTLTTHTFPRSSAETTTSKSTPTVSTTFATPTTSTTPVTLSTVTLKTSAPTMESSTSESTTRSTTKTTLTTVSYTATSITSTLRATPTGREPTKPTTPTSPGEFDGQFVN
ncbi:mucin-6 [Carettochelys insculpta]|uniref:mucin-6 n=1 Tax=Carettochelys insculpta TaxID=44489 RepID=UPI003EBAACD5